MYFYTSLDEDEIKELQGKKFTDMRTPSHDYKIKAKQQDMISKIATLLIENKPTGSSTSSSDTATASSLADELKKLKGLLDSGALTQEEYDAAKKKLLEK